MATGLLETGPKLDWTRDNKIFDRYQIWKEKVELIFSSALEESSSKQKVSYLRYWMGEQGIPLVKKWTALGKLDFSSSEENDLSSGYILQNYWNLLEAEFKPKGNKLLSVIELWTRSKQGSKTLNEWLTYVYNLVESCDYGDSSERIIRDVLIIGCNSDKAKDKIVRQGEKIKLQDVLEILQLEDSTRQTLTEMTSNTQKIHYASYEKKKGIGKKQKFQSNPNSSSSSSSGQKQDSTNSQKLCYRCSKNYTKGHEKVCKALNAKCNACGVEGHFEIACKKSGNFPKKSSSKFQKPGSTGRMNIASAVEEPALQADFFDEKGILKEYKPKSMYVLSGTSDDKPIMIEFGCGLTPLSFDRKLILQADTGADMNAINKKTFNEVFPDVELEESTQILQNFDKRLIKPIGSFRCFLRWKGHKYRVKFEVMGIETPNLLSRETTFLMGILKKCLSVETASNKPNDQISSLSVSGHSVPSTKAAPDAPETSTEAGPLTPAEAAPVPFTEDVSCHSVPPMEATPVPSTEGVFCHSVPLTEDTAPLTSTDRSQMNCASIPNTAETSDSSSVRVVGSNNHSLSITDLPLTQEKVETTYADVFQGLGKFPGEPYKLRLKPDAVPAKHRPRRVPVHLQNAFHEEVERLVKIDVLEKVTEPTEWVNSFVIVEKVIDSSNAHSPNHVIKKSIRLCIDPKDLNEALEREPYYSRSIDELISMFAGAKVFTIVDMDKGYWQVVLHPESRKLTCMAFDIGRYQFKRLPSVQTDQKPLVSIFRKHMIDVSPRIQRITIRAWQYDFIPQHIPGRINVIADSLSRVTPLEFQDSNPEKDILAVNFLQYSSIEERERDEMLQETSKDKELQSLKHYISTGWPAKRSQIPMSLHPYWNFRDELTVESGILMKNSKVLIPETLKQKYLKQIHQGHQGIEACRSRAREFVFWVNINSDLKEMVEKCDICQSQQNSTTSVQKYVSEVPPHPWHTLGSDLFYFQRIDFLVVVDYFSKYLIVRKIPSSTSSAVIKELGMIFSEFGNPLVFRSDNGPCYSSQEFKFFMQNWLVEHRTSSPHYPQSNGLAESMVKVSKNLIEKALKQDLPWNRLLLDYRCTPISGEIPSPAEILFGRKFRSSISILPSQVLNDRISRQRELIAKKEGKFYASTQDFQDRIKALPFEAGQNVWLQNSDSRKFEEAVIREKCREPNSYMVQIPATGQCFRRNSNFIKPRQTDKNSVSTDPQPTTDLPEIPQEPPVFQQPSSQATNTVDAIPTVPPSKQNENSTPRTPRQPRTSRRSTKGIPPARLGLQE